MTRLVERLNAVRHHVFVGRESECTLFRAAVCCTELPFSVLHVFGFGGVGKTTLLWQFRQICHSLKVPVTYLDARSIEPSPRSFLDAVAIDSAPQTGEPSRRVLIIDSYERLTALEDWLRSDFLPQLPEQMLVVLAGRCSPTAAWQADPGWQALFRVVELHRFEIEDSQLYLTKRSIRSSDQAAIVEFTQGHPLALSLTADLWIQEQATEITANIAATVRRILLKTLLQEVPSSRHRSALEACSIVRSTTEALLSELLVSADVQDLFEWLQGLSLMQTTSFGLMPDPVVRGVIRANLRWRHPDRWTELHQRSRNYYAERLSQTHGQVQQQLMWDMLFLHADQSVVASRFVWQAESHSINEFDQDIDRAAILEMVTQHEGADSARLAAYWLDRQPQNVIVCRNAKQQITGFAIVVALHQTTAEDLKTDSVVATTWRDVNHSIRAGEGALLYRFWMEKETYQAVSPTQSLIFISAAQLDRPGVAITLFACSEPDQWNPLAAYLGLSRHTEAEFKVGTRHYAVYGHDWRQVPAAGWEQIGQQAHFNSANTTVSEAPVILDQAEFTQAVRNALRQFARPDALYHSPLLRSRLVLEQPNIAACTREKQIALLQSRLREASELLKASPRDEKLYRALHRTYFQPAPTQEQAAELLNLPFSTYRRYLKAGVARVADILWQREVRSS